MFPRMVNTAGLVSGPQIPPQVQGLVLAGAAAALAVAVAGCGSSATTAASAKSTAVISAIGAENEYANVLSQIGGQYVHVSSILNNPNTDPHTFESSPSVASEVSAAQLIVQNGVGYDTFMNKIESASPNADAQGDHCPERARAARQHP